MNDKRFILRKGVDTHYSVEFRNDGGTIGMVWGAYPSGQQNYVWAAKLNNRLEHKVGFKTRKAAIEWLLHEYDLQEKEGT